MARVLFGVVSSILTRATTAAWLTAGLPPSMAAGKTARRCFPGIGGNTERQAGRCVSLPLAHQKAVRVGLAPSCVHMAAGKTAPADWCQKSADMERQVGGWILLVSPSEGRSSRPRSTSQERHTISKFSVKGGGRQCGIPPDFPGGRPSGLPILSSE